MRTASDALKDPITGVILENCWLTYWPLSEQEQTPWPLPRTIAKEQSACSVLNSLAPRVESVIVVSVMPKAGDTPRWMWVSHSRCPARMVTCVGSEVVLETV